MKPSVKTMYAIAAVVQLELRKRNICEDVIKGAVDQAHDCLIHGLSGWRSSEVAIYMALAEAMSHENAERYIHFRRKLKKLAPEKLACLDLLCAPPGPVLVLPREVDFAH